MELKRESECVCCMILFENSIKCKVLVTHHTLRPTDIRFYFMALNEANEKEKKNPFHFENDKDILYYFWVVVALIIRLIQIKRLKLPSGSSLCL